MTILSLKHSITDKTIDAAHLTILTFYNFLVLLLINIVIRTLSLTKSLIDELYAIRKDNSNIIDSYCVLNIICSDIRIKKVVSDGFTIGIIRREVEEICLMASIDFLDLKDVS